MTTEAQKRAINKYNASKTMVLGCKVQKEKGMEVKNILKERGETPNNYIKKLISSDLKIDL